MLGTVVSAIATQAVGGGTVGGIVKGGTGDDVYYIRNANLRITDVAGAADLIFTTVSTRISAGIEGLFADAQNGAQLTGSARNDTVVGNLGNDTIFGGNGNDTLNGGGGEDLAYGGRGDDLLTLIDLLDQEESQLFGGDGNDEFRWQGGLGTMTGGAGVDLFSYSSAVGGLAIDVDLTAGTASSINTGTLQIKQTVTLSQIEDARGTQLNDTLDGSNGVNQLEGLNGNDSLSGLGANDTLFGGDGNDTLSGGANQDQLFGGNNDDVLNGDESSDTIAGDAGRDTMTGGAGVDSFVFASVSHSAVATPDLVTDFAPAQDTIDLGLIDADPALANDQGSAFIGTGAFVGTSAQVRYFQDAGLGLTIVQVQLEGGSTPSMEIALTGLLTLNGANFFL